MSMRIPSIPAREPLAVKIVFYYDGVKIDGYNDEFIISLKKFPDTKDGARQIEDYINDRIYHNICMISDQNDNFIFERIDYTVQIARIRMSLLDWYEYEPLTKTVTKTFWMWKK